MKAARSIGSHLIMTFIVNELTPEEKSAIEKLLGRRIHAGETLSIGTFEQPQRTSEQKLEMIKELERYFAQVDQLAAPCSEQEYEDVFIEAMRSVRPGYRRHS
jgi:hypothetical protein